jgi:hypothetical protein
MTKASDSGGRQPASGRGMAFDGAGYIVPLREGYSRKGGQNTAPTANSPRPPAPPPFRPASATISPTAAGDSAGKK